LALLCLKKRQSRREERGLVIPNERRATPSGAFSDATPHIDVEEGAGAIGFVLTGPKTAGLANVSVTRI
ncbi:MAG: hypothetical protein AB2735_09315, partial [Candidatus Thiodiazotropha taylori]